MFGTRTLENILDAFDVTIGPVAVRLPDKLTTDVMGVTSDSTLTPQHPYLGNVRKKNECSCGYHGFLVHDVQLLRNSGCNESGAKDGRARLRDEVWRGRKGVYDLRRTLGRRRIRCAHGTTALLVVSTLV